jgi:hypothetical protein
VRRVHYVIALVVVTALAVAVAYVMSRTAFSFQVVDYDGQPAPLAENPPVTGPVADAMVWILIALGVLGGGAAVFTIWAVVRQMRRIDRGR